MNIAQLSSQLIRVNRLLLYRGHVVGLCSHSQTSESPLKFEEAKKRLLKLKIPPDPLQTLQLYGLYKQSTHGSNPKPRPAVSPQELAKWDAWYDVKGLSQSEAKEQYARMVQTLLEQNGEIKELEPFTSNKVDPSQTYPGLSVVQDETGVTRVFLNRPQKLNAFNFDMFQSLPKALEQGAQDERVKFVVLQGHGQFFSSGNDLSSFMQVLKADVHKNTLMARDILHAFVQSLIEFPKPLIAAVNGPAIGIGCTLLGLCDVVYASDRAYFSTPFSHLAQTPEGCSSYLFPKIMGPSLGREVLFMGRKLSAVEAKDAGFVSQVFGEDIFQAEVDRRVRDFAKVSFQSVALSKHLVNGHLGDTLSQVNTKECDLLLERWRSPEVHAILEQFNKRT